MNILLIFCSAAKLDKDSPVDMRRIASLQTSTFRVAFSNTISFLVKLFPHAKTFEIALQYFGMLRI